MTHLTAIKLKIQIQPSYGQPDDPQCSVASVIKNVLMYISVLSVKHLLVIYILAFFLKDLNQR